jgi:hypothetical protein
MLFKARLNVRFRLYLDDQGTSPTASEHEVEPAGFAIVADMVFSRDLPRKGRINTAIAQAEDMTDVTCGNSVNQPFQGRRIVLFSFIRQKERHRKIARQWVRERVQPKTGFPEEVLKIAFPLQYKRAVIGSKRVDPAT